MVSLKGALKKAKLKQLLKIVITSVIVVLIMLPISFTILYKTGNYFTAKTSTKLNQQLFLHNQIAEPNIQIDSQVKANTSLFFGGNIVTNRSKNINGYLVPWSTLTSSYDWIRTNIDGNELTPGLGSYNYDKQTKNKVANFYNPFHKKYTDGVQNDLGAVSQMQNYVAEVAISFDRPYTFKEIQAKIPHNLNIVWLYMTSEIGDLYKVRGIDPDFYGFDPSDSPKDAFKSFIEALEKYNEYNETIKKFLNSNKNKQLNEVKILGVMLTGQTKNFKVLENKDFIRGASVGSTAQIVPYIKANE